MSLLSIGLLGENYHFLADCIAGEWLGGTVAIYVVAIPNQNEEVVS
ncbi:MAG: hypothetical protein ACH346_01945 [Chthoniobacterales bacterium]